MDAWKQYPHSDWNEKNFPLSDYEPSRKNKRLQKKHPLSEAEKYFAQAHPCPKCQKPATELSWFYYEDSEEAWKNLCGCGGWVTACDACGIRVDFFLEMIS